MTSKLLTSEQRGMLAVIDDDPGLADSTKRQYTKTLVNLWSAGVAITSTEELKEYAAGLCNSSRGFLKAAIAKVTAEEADKIRATVTPETVGAATAALMRIEALNSVVKVETADGEKTHIWLNQQQTRELFAAAGNGIRGQRDRIVLGLLVAAGLRRSEAAALEFSDIKLQPVGDRFRAVLAIKGKGAKNRSVPISDKLAAALDEWRTVCGGGKVCRSLGMNRELGDSLSGVAVFDIVRKIGRRIGFTGDDQLAAHDLRRTYAQLGHQAGVPITQISKLLGHASVATTQRYLNMDLDLESTVSDFVPFE